MKIKLSLSFKTKLLALFMLISAVPLVLAIMLNALNLISDAQQSIEKDIELRNRIVQEKINELYEKNFDVLRVFACTPITRNYLLSKSEERDETLENLMVKTNSVLKDNNNLIITDINGNQLIRSDGFTLVNVLHRKYFWEAMAGREAISEVLVSYATGRFISVVEAPVLDDDNRVIGFVQRDYELSSLQEFVHSLATDQTYVLIIDKTGHMLAHSSRKIETESDRTDESNYAFVTKALSGEFGHVRSIFEGEDSFIYYSRNPITGWAIITIQSEKFIKSHIYRRAIIAFSFGIFMLIIITISAYILSDKLTQPLISLSKTVLKIANNNIAASNLDNVSGDELEQMVTAFGKIQANHQNLQHESETDNLTQLYNKSTTEKICNFKLKNMPEGTKAALFIIDLDHFKEANDTYGHHHGDLILQEFASQLRDAFTQNDCVGRFGGDEFIVLMENVENHEEIENKAQEVMDIARKLVLDQKPAKLSTSIGIAIAPKDGKDYDTLFNIADKSLYLVKNEGRDGYCYDCLKVLH